MKLEPKWLRDYFNKPTWTSRRREASLPFRDRLGVQELVDLLSKLQVRSAHVHSLSYVLQVGYPQRRPPK